jgi:hypothetical protein
VKSVALRLWVVVVLLLLLGEAWPMAAEGGTTIM